MSLVKVQRRNLFLVALALSAVIVYITSHHPIEASSLRMSPLSGFFDRRPEETDNDFDEILETTKKTKENVNNPGGYLGDISEVDPGEAAPLVGADDPDLRNVKLDTNTPIQDQVDPDSPATLPEVQVPEFLVSLLKQPVQFRIYSHNIKNGMHITLAEGELPWEDRRADVVASIRLHASRDTVVVLQEALAFQIDYILEQLNLYRPEGLRWAAYGGGRRNGRKEGEHVPILVRADVWEVPYHDTFWLNPVDTRTALRGWDAKFPRICTVATLHHRASGAYVNVFNTHFDHKGNQARIESAKLIVSRMNTLNEWPSLLAGDLNLKPNQECYKTLAEHLQDVQKLTARYNQYGHRENTVTGFLRNSESEPLRIDYIFAPQYASRLLEKPCGTEPVYLQVQGYGVLHSKFGGFYMSDHRPVVADFELGNCEKKQGP